jgi:hypothetical protein
MQSPPGAQSIEHEPPVHVCVQSPLPQSLDVQVAFVQFWWQSPPGHVSLHVSPVVQS